ncbi:hypothetical protein TrVE_jg14208 [Triparma verrucosa]|uniref:KANL3/Tex30 alpha/beta hydrolase-like domain-containing protein n=1 Tax=Triparma verrucosa TaxID=1606542 RepID=A0A9W7B6I5_9STRA|nr:hypothetical protein TrVE_jg14208 [Triparma verrucosa]
MTDNDYSHVIFFTIAGSSGKFSTGPQAGIPEFISAAVPGAEVLPPLPGMTEGKRLVGGNGVTERVLLHAHEALLNTCQQNPDKKIIVVTSSFGGRVASHLMAGKAERKPKENVKRYFTPADFSAFSCDNFGGAISFGYPLSLDKGQSREKILLNLENVRFFFVAGSKDPMIRGLQEVAASMESNSNNCIVYHEVPGGGHNPLKVTKSKKRKAEEVDDEAEAEAEAILPAQIRAFVDGFSAS